MGDKVVSVTSRGDASGVKEVDQNLVNIDEGKTLSSPLMFLIL